MNDVSFVIGKFSDICEVIDREYVDSVSIARLCRAIKANLIAVKDGGQSLENSSVMDDIEDLFGEIEQYDFHKVHDTGVLNQIRLLFLVMALGKANQEQYDEGLAEVKSNEDKGYIVRANNKIEEDEEGEDEYDEDDEDDEDFEDDLDEEDEDFEDDLDEEDDEFESMTFSEILNDFEIQFKDSMDFTKSVIKMLAHIPADQHAEVGVKLAFIGLGLVHANSPGDFEQFRASIAHVIPAKPEKAGNVTKLAQRRTNGGAKLTMFDLPKGMDF